MEFNSLSKGSNPKRLPIKDFKLPIEQSMRIIDEVRKVQKFTKTIRPDQSRKQYQQLLEWVKTSLQATKSLVHTQSSQLNDTCSQNPQPQTIQEQVQMQQRKVIQSLMSYMIEMFKKQCKQKSQLMQVCFDYFNQLINVYARHYEKQFIQTLKTYNIKLDELEQQYEQKLIQCNKKITFLQGQKQTKWKNIYMLAKDNRILRRQKGKLMRSVQQQDQKIKIMSQELCQVVKQNQTNKLVIRFQNDNQNLKVFMRNRLALMKFQKIIQRYPKKALKVLNNDLLKLQIQELNSLDGKIDYIKRVITESGDIFDQYEDLNQLVSKPNKMVFNMYTQTQLDDIQPPKQFKQTSTIYQLQFTHNKFDHWQQIYDIKILGFPQLKQKYVCFRNPNRKLTNKITTQKKRFDNQKKDFFVMSICPRQVYQLLNIKCKKKGEQFDYMQCTGVTYNPKLKNKSKFYFISIYDTKNITLNQIQNQNDIIFRQTMSANIKKSKQIGYNNRKSQTLNQGKYALNRFSTFKSSNKKRSSQALSFQQQINQLVQENRDNQTIDQKSQLQSQDNSQTQDQQDSNKLLNDISYQNLLPKFKKAKRTTRRTTDLSPLGMERKSTPKMSVFKQQSTNGATQRNSVNIYQKNQKQKKKSQRISTEGSSKRRTKQKNSIYAPKMNRIKTSQNERNSNSSSKHKGNMEFIYEEQNQNDDNHAWQKVKQQNRLSYKQPLNSFKSSKFYDTINNFGCKQNYMNQIQGILAQRNKKYHMTMIPGSIPANKKISKVMGRNSSFNLMKFKNRQSVNMDTCSMNSHISSQNESTFNYKNYMTQLKPKQSIQSLQSQVLNPLLIKPFEVKKLAQKIIKNIYSRRKQLLSSPTSTSLKGFIEHFLKQIYGNNWKGQKNLLRYSFSVEDRQATSNIKVFSLMLNTNVQIQYLQDLFRLYVTMLQKNEFSGSDNPLITNKVKGLGIIKYLLSIYFDETTANDIQQNLPFMSQYEIDLNQIFIVVQTQIRKFTVQTQIYSFLSKLLPQNQSNIEFSQIKEVLYFFKNEQKYHTHIARLKYFFKTNGKIVAQQQNLTNKLENGKTGKTSNTAEKPAIPTNKNLSKQSQVKQQVKIDIEILPIHRVCLYLKRYQWTDLLEINSFIEQKYHKQVGVFIQEQTIKFITKYCVVLSERGSKKKTFYQGGIINIAISQQNTNQSQVVHPLYWLLQRTKQLIRNYYRYKGPLDRYFLMFVHISILTYEIEVGVNDVLSDTLGLLNLEYKKLKTKQEVDVFMKQ